MKQIPITGSFVNVDHPSIASVAIAPCMDVITLFLSFGLKYFIKKFTRNFFRFGTVVPGRSICTSCWKCWFSTVRNEELVAKMNLAICKSIAYCFDEDLPMTLKVDCFSCLACGAFFFLRRCT